jgi:hypothetical protein
MSDPMIGKSIFSQLIALQLPRCFFDHLDYFPHRIGTIRGLNHYGVLGFTGEDCKACYPELKGSRTRI